MTRDEAARHLHAALPPPVSFSIQRVEWLHADFDFAAACRREPAAQHAAEEWSVIVQYPPGTPQYLEIVSSGALIEAVAGAVRRFTQWQASGQPRQAKPPRLNAPSSTDGGAARDAAAHKEAS